MPINRGTIISTFADKTAILGVHENAQEASKLLQDYVHKFENWLKNWKIEINEQILL